MVHVIAEVDLHGGKRNAWLAEFGKIVETVRAEDGCIEYGAAVDAETGIDRQAPHRPDAVTVVEKWRDVAALKAHLFAPHMAAYRQAVQEMVKGFTLRILNPA